MRVNYETNEEARAALAGIGRTEDVVFSPDGTRLAIAGFEQARLLVLDVEEAAGRLRLGHALSVSAAVFDMPHGIDWLDDETLIVANRGGLLPVVTVPRQANATELVAEPWATLGRSAFEFIETPGSVVARRLDGRVTEVLVCNNYAHHVSRHMLDHGDGYRVLGSDVVARDGLLVPDGLALSHDGRWLAVSNHYDQSVFVYNTAALGETDEPVAVLRGLAYAHGLRFTPDDRALLVADAGAPLVHIYARPGARWNGTQGPVDSIEVIAPEVFARGNRTKEEGGPKGLALSPGGLLLVTCEEEPLAVFDISARLTALGLMPFGPAPVAAAVDAEAAVALSQRRGAEQAEAAMRQGREAVSRLAKAEARAEKFKDARERVRRMERSLSWRVTKPLRAVTRLLRGRR